ARLGLARGLEEHGNVVNAAIRDGSGKRKAGGAGYGEIVTGGVLDLHGVACPGNEANHRAANGKSGLRTNDLHIVDGAVGSAGAVKNGASLARVRGLRKDR